MISAVDIPACTLLGASVQPGCPITPVKSTRNRNHDDAVCPTETTDFSPNKQSLVQLQLKARRKSPVCWSFDKLVPVVQYARNVCKVSRNRFAYGDLERVKRAFPHLLLNPRTIRRCFFQGDQILHSASRMQMTSEQKTRGYVRKGHRAVVSQGRVRRCLGPQNSIKLWYHCLENLQLSVSFDDSLTHQLDVFQAHKHILGTLVKLMPQCDTRQTFWASELQAISQRIVKLQGQCGASTNWSRVRELEETLKLNAFAFTKVGNVQLPESRRCNIEF